VAFGARKFFLSAGTEASSVFIFLPDFRRLQLRNFFLFACLCMYMSGRFYPLSVALLPTPSLTAQLSFLSYVAAAALVAVVVADVNVLFAAINNNRHQVRLSSAAPTSSV